MEEKDKSRLIEEDMEKHDDADGQKEHGYKHEEHKKKKKKEDAAEELKKELVRKEEEIKSLQDRILYLQADFENFKKLKAKEKLDTLRYANEEIVKDLLPVVDNLERALAHSESTDDHKSIHEGVRITLNEFLKVLKKSGATPIDAIGQKFDPNFHEALYQEERGDMDADTVVSEVQKGYILNDRLIRPSRVGVSKKPEIQ